MSRLRATLATNPLDRELATRVESARREILEAIRRVNSDPGTNPIDQRRRFAVRRDLERVLGAMESVRRVRPLYDLSDPDLVPTPPRKKEPPEPKKE